VLKLQRPWLSLLVGGNIDVPAGVIRCCCFALLQVAPVVTCRSDLTVCCLPNLKKWTCEFRSTSQVIVSPKNLNSSFCSPILSKNDYICRCGGSWIGDQLSHILPYFFISSLHLYNITGMISEKSADTAKVTLVVVNIKPSYFRCDSDTVRRVIRVLNDAVSAAWWREPVNWQLVYILRCWKSSVRFLHISSD